MDRIDRPGSRTPSGVPGAAALASLLVLALAASAAPASGQASDDRAPFARFPAVSPDGGTVAFSYQGDIFTVPAEGGVARRLTLHEAYEGHPRWSPDGERIAFQSDRFGNEDIFVMGSAGQRVRRLTHHSTDDELGGWTPDGDLLFTTERTWVQVEREEEIYRVSAEGGTPDRLLDAVGYAPRISPDGRFIAFTFGSNDRYRKGYRGPADKDVWVHDTREGTYRRVTGFEGNDIRPAWGGPRSLYFLSERGGAYNLHRVEVGEDGEPAGEVRRLTDYAEDGLRYFGVSADGGTVVFERRTGLYRLDLGGGGEAAAGPDSARRLEIRVPEDDRFYAVEPRSYSSEAEEYAVSPDGEYVAFVVRGEIFLTPNDPEEDRTVRLTEHPHRDRDVAWLSDSTLVFASDRDGDYDLYRLRADDPETTDLYFAVDVRVERLTDTDALERGPVPSPDRERVAFRRGRGALVVAAVAEDGLGEETVLLDGWATPDDVAWSPDSRWLAYSLPDLDFNEEVYVHAADGSRGPVNVSQHPRPDGSPFWSRDGSKLGFVSNRNNGDDDIWFAWLREEDWQRAQEDRELMKARRQKAEKQEADAGGEGGEEDVEPVEIDLDRIWERLRQVTALPGNESDVVISHDGETFWFVSNRDGWKSYFADQDLYRVKWDGTGMEALTEDDTAPYGLRLGPDGERLFMLASGRLQRVHGETGEREGLPYEARMEVDHPEELAQVFDEAWRLLDRNFYDPEFHGEDWEALREEYRPRALRASTRRDFRDVFNMMLGELNASHLGLYGPDRSETQEVRTGLLGVEIDPVEDGVRVERVVPESPADRDTSRLREGDVITAVDGRRVRPGENFYRLLEDRVEDRVVLRVRAADGEERRVVIRPTDSLSGQLYEEWVRDREELTREYSDGELGYIHVRAMVWPYFERFERELVASGSGKDGLVVDVRYNGGGWTTDYMLTVLTYPQHAYTVPRGAAADLDASHTDFRAHYPFGERLPQAAWTRPTAALCNANSFSNAEIFSHAYKNLDLGTLVGEPTFGAVISTGGAGLIDGSFVRLPFRGWYVKATDRNMENGPAVPDIVVRRRPDDRADGEDEQLRAAVEDLLERTGSGGG